MAELIVHSIACIEPTDCQLTIEVHGTVHQLFARRVSVVPWGDGSSIPCVDGFEPISVFRNLALSAFQIKQLVQLCTEIRSGASLTFPMRISESG